MAKRAGAAAAAAATAPGATTKKDAEPANAAAESDAAAARRRNAISASSPVPPPPGWRASLAVGAYIYFVPVALLLNLLMVIVHRYSRLLWLAWALAINLAPAAKRAPKTGRWPKPLRRWLALWGPLASYFPARLHRTAVLDPVRRYLFVAAPHGLVTMFVWVAFDTDAAGFSRLFPGIDPVPLTLEINFKLPLLREFLLLHGIGDASMAACLTLLGRGDGSAILLAAGGAEESLLAAPGSMDLVLAKRKGFVRAALTTGALLVPVIGFGENELYGSAAQEEKEEEKKQGGGGGGAAAAGERRGKGRRRLASAVLKRLFGFVLPEIRGVGPLGLMPRPSPLDVVIGPPVEFDERRAVAAARARRRREAEGAAVAAAVAAAAGGGAGGGGAGASGGGAGRDKAATATATGEAKGAPPPSQPPPPQQPKPQPQPQPQQQEEGDDDYSFPDMVDGYHQQYREALLALYAAHKDRFLPGRARDLEIVK